MSIHVALNHVTHYRYDRPIMLGPQVVRLRPAPHSRTRILSYSMKVAPATHFINWQQDPQANYLARLVFPEPTTEFRVEVDLVAEMAVFNPFDFFLEPSAEQYPFTYEPDLLVELAPYLRKAEVTPRFAEYLASIDTSPRQTNGFLVALNQKLQGDIAYLIRMEPGVQTPELTLCNASGSCRDSAWLMVQLLRHLGLAARFVSGYLIQLKSDQKSLDGPSGTEVDFTDLHAWCEVYLPGAGWIGLDPTSGLYAGEGHIPLACSPEPSSAAPISGLIEPCETTFEHLMSVQRIWEAPRVTLPYSEAQWTAIDALGDKVDADLQRHDVRLTQGGEPTFVSIDDREGMEWSTEAMGPNKRGLSDQLMQRMREKYGAGGLMHYGQGKWYPGEQLPRWSLNLFWRRDGKPIWHDPKLFAGEKDDPGATVKHAAEFLQRLAIKLGVDRRNVFGAYEDAAYFLWRERKLPSNVDPHDPRLADAQERARMQRVFDAGLGKPVGYVLPIARSEREPGRWRSTPWYLRGGRCFLIPGDSPVGFRLPLDSLPWASPQDMPWLHAPDPTQVFAPLPDPDLPEAPAWHSTNEVVDAPAEEFKHETPGGHHDIEANGGMPRATEPGSEKASLGLHESAGFVVRTAMSVEPRNGRLYLFMPPTDSLDAYLALCAAIEAAARDMRMPVVLEGYEPPRDPRLALLRITPDPGVIEVNVQPVDSWKELVEQTTYLYGVARETRLTTEKFMLDGRHTGTGGGNHFVLGGKSTNDSPFLRRPDLLASMIGYWHNHPALSYLFSGMFVGPTSQAPRIDEARNDSVYEIEIAFAELRRVAEAEAGKSPPWLIDRLLRNLLIDVTGNTHRAEFCIDKLYSPDGPHRPPRPARDARLRDAAARPHEPGPAVADAGPRGALLGRALPAGAAGALGHRAARPLDAAALHLERPGRGGRRAKGLRLSLRDGLVRRPPRFPLPAARRFRGRRRGGRAAHGARALARAGRGGRRRRHRTLCRFDARADRAARQGPRRRPPPPQLQRPPHPPAGDRRRRRVRRRGALPRLDGAVVAAPDHRSRCAPGLRPRRYGDEPLPRRLPVPRGPPGRRELRELSGQRPGGRSAPARPFLPHGPHAGPARGAGRSAQPRLPLHARPAPAAGVMTARPA